MEFCFACRPRPLGPFFKKSEDVARMFETGFDGEEITLQKAGKGKAITPTVLINRDVAKLIKKL